jgi:hypothetical protein
MSFRMSALPVDRFQELFAMSDEALRAHGAKRYVADHAPGFPCRVSLQDAMPGERVILVPYPHQPAESPYKACGPIFVRELATQAVAEPGQVPEVLRVRTLSVRGYSRHSMMVDATVVEGPQLESAIGKLFANARVDYLHVHYAAPGCYACRVDRIER